MRPRIVVACLLLILQCRLTLQDKPHAQGDAAIAQAADAAAMTVEKRNHRIEKQDKVIEDEQSRMERQAMARAKVIAALDAAKKRLQVTKQLSVEERADAAKNNVGRSPRAEAARQLEKSFRVSAGVAKTYTDKQEQRAYEMSADVLQPEREVGATYMQKELADFHAVHKMAKQTMHQVQDQGHDATVAAEVMTKGALKRKHTIWKAVQQKVRRATLADKQKAELDAAKRKQEKAHALAKTSERHTKTIWAFKKARVSGSHVTQNADRDAHDLLRVSGKLRKRAERAAKMKNKYAEKDANEALASVMKGQAQTRKAVALDVANALKMHRAKKAKPKPKPEHDAVWKQAVRALHSFQHSHRQHHPMIQHLVAKVHMKKEADTARDELLHTETEMQKQGLEKDSKHRLASRINEKKGVAAMRHHAAATKIEIAALLAKENSRKEEQRQAHKQERASKIKKADDAVHQIREAEAAKVAADAEERNTVKLGMNKLKKHRLQMKHSMLKLGENSRDSTQEAKHEVHSVMKVDAERKMKKEAKEYSQKRHKQKRAAEKAQKIAHAFKAAKSWHQHDVSFGEASEQSVLRGSSRARKKLTQQAMLDNAQAFQKATAIGQGLLRAQRSVKQAAQEKANKVRPEFKEAMQEQKVVQLHTKQQVSQQQQREKHVEKVFAREAQHAEELRQDTLDHTPLPSKHTEKHAEDDIFDHKKALSVDRFLESLGP